VTGEIVNARTLLRRNGGAATEDTLARLKMLSGMTRRAHDLASLLGMEGTVARLYFEAFAHLLSPRTRDGTVGVFAFEDRNHRVEVQGLH
jgi:CRISP-associated protein Cas1